MAIINHATATSSNSSSDAEYPNVPAWHYTGPDFSVTAEQTNWFVQSITEANGFAMNKIPTPKFRHRMMQIQATFAVVLSRALKTLDWKPIALIADEKKAEILLYQPAS